MKRRKIMIIAAVILILTLAGTAVYAQSQGEGDSFGRRIGSIFGGRPKIGNFIGQGSKEDMTGRQEIHDEVKALHERFREALENLKEELGEEFSKDNEQVQELHKNFMDELKALRDEYGITGDFGISDKFGRKGSFPPKNKIFPRIGENAEGFSEIKGEIKAIMDEFKVRLDALKEELGDDFSRDNEQVKALHDWLKNELNEIREEYDIAGFEFEGKFRNGNQKPPIHSFMPNIKGKIESLPEDKRDEFKALMDEYKEKFKALGTELRGRLQEIIGD